MIDYISGTLAELTPTVAVIDNQGIGYAAEISLQTYEAFLGKQQVKAYMVTCINQRDATEVTYGFASKEEREIFNLITGISGIGASTARMILSSMSSEEFRDAILSENINKIKSVKGIGLKGAQRMILELKDKIVKGGGSVSEALFAQDNNADIEEATRALTMLGFAKPNVNKAVQTIVKNNPGAKVEEIIKAALKTL